MSEVTRENARHFGVFDKAPDPRSQAAPIANAAGGAVVDVEARAALNTLLTVLREYGLIDV